MTIVSGILAAFVLRWCSAGPRTAASGVRCDRRGTGLIAMMIVSIGLSIFLRNVFQYFAGGDTKNYSQFTSPKPWKIGPS